MAQPYKFQRGDKVKVIEAYTCYACRGKILMITKVGRPEPYIYETEDIKGHTEIFAEEALVQVETARFYLGDTVTVKRKCSGCVPGEKYILKLHGSKLFATHPHDRGTACCHEQNWEKLEEAKPMSLTDRIESLDNGWDKEADNLLQEIIGDTWVEIAVRKSDIKVRVYNKIGAEFNQKFYFDSQCSKNTAFKNTLHWLVNTLKLDGLQDGDIIDINVKGKEYKVKVLSCRQPGGGY